MFESSEVPQLPAGARAVVDGEVFGGVVCPVAELLLQVEARTAGNFGSRPSGAVSPPSGAARLPKNKYRNSTALTRLNGIKTFMGVQVIHPRVHEIMTSPAHSSREAKDP